MKWMNTPKHYTSEPLFLDNNLCFNYKFQTSHKHCFLLCLFRETNSTEEAALFSVECDGFSGGQLFFPQDL